MLLRFFYIFDVYDCPKLLLNNKNLIFDQPMLFKIEKMSDLVSSAKAYID